jgi:hypothetical protein
MASERLGRQDDLSGRDTTGLPAIMLALALSGLTSPARAQEERGQLWDVQTISVRPDHIDEFMTEIAAQPGIREVYEQVEAWSYVPPNPTFEIPTFAQRFDF